MALLSVCRVDEDADADVRIDGVVVVEVEAADGSAAFVQVNHQAELLLAGQVVVIQQKLFDLEARVGNESSTDAPNGAVVLPSINPLGIVGLGATERNRVVFYEHGGSMVENLSFIGRLARILICNTDQIFRQNYTFRGNKGRKIALMRI